MTGGAVFGKWAGWLGFGRARAAPTGVDILRLSQLPQRFYAVGDVHGCCDLYLQLEAQLAAIGAAPEGGALVVLLGDVIDRGPATAQLLDHLVAPPPAGIRRVVLRGNHEAMFLRFWAAPRLDDAWLGYGGAEMLASYGINLGDPALARKGRLRQVLDSCIPAEHVEFLSRTPLALALPGFVLAHAGINPDLDLEAQREGDVLWGNPDRLDDRADMGASDMGAADVGAVVIHGHRPRPDGQGYMGRGRINVDTGAYVTGRLTAVEVVDGRARRFVVAQRGDSS
jgi:serine/threonine protein phosphatase 1